MPSAAYQRFNVSSLDVLLGKHNFASDVFKVYLTNVAPNAATHGVKADIAEIAAGNGYTAGGLVIPIDAVTQTNGVGDVSTDESTLQIVAAGGSIGPFRYAVAYNDTHASDPLLSFFDYGSSVTVQSAENFAIPLPASLFTGGFA